VSTVPPRADPNPSAPAVPWGDARAACLWLPHLPLRLEVARRPDLDGRPLVLGAAPGQRRVVQLCSPEAEQAGLRAGLPLREVASLCPDAVVVQPDPARVGAARDEVLAALQGVSPGVEPADDAFFLDLRGLPALYAGDLTRLDAAVRAAVPPLLQPRLGIAAGRAIAGIAARHAPPGGRLVVRAGDAAAFLRPLPVDRLPLGTDALGRLRLLGLHTVGAFADLPFGPVQAQFGAEGARAWRLARGVDDAPVVPHPHAPAVEAVLRLDDPLVSIDAVLGAVRRLVDRVFADGLLRGRAARGARLRALLANGTSWEQVYTFKEPQAGPDGALRALRAKLALPGALPTAAVEEIALALTGIGGVSARQGRLWQDQAQLVDQVAAVARQLRARYGETPLYRAVPLEPWSRIPERRWALAELLVGDGP
jgi:DNA polymerase-4/protein ImuB